MDNIFSETIIERAFWNGIKQVNADREHPITELRWRASSAGKCDILQLLSAYGYEADPITPDDAFKFEMGNIGEDLFMSAIGHGLGDGLVLQQQYNVVSPDLKVGGHVDAVLLDGDKIHSALEVKTLNSFFTARVEKSVETAYFYGQLQTYMHLLDLETITLIIIERNTPKLITFEVPIDYAYLMDAICIWNDLNKWYEEGYIPFPNEVGGEVKCQYCKYKSICGGNNTKIIALREKHGEIPALDLGAGN